MNQVRPFQSLPSARFVMMVRDGRDTMLSLKERYPNEDVAGPFVLGRWINDNSAGLAYEGDPRLLIVKLEVLLERGGERITRDLLALKQDLFLGLIGP